MSAHANETLVVVVVVQRTKQNKGQLVDALRYATLPPFARVSQ